MPDQALKVENVTVKSDSTGTWLVATGTVTNTGAEKTNLSYITIVIFDAGGKPIGWFDDVLSATGLLAGQKKGFTMTAFISGSVAKSVKSKKIYAYALDF